MAGGLCDIHGTELNGFSSFSFCNECDAENKHQEKYEEDKEASIVGSPDDLNGYGFSGSLIDGVHIDGFIPGVVFGANSSITTGTLDVDKSDQYGWIVHKQQLSVGQAGQVDILAGQLIDTEEPKFSFIAPAIYRVELSTITTVLYCKGTLRVLNDTSVYLEQILYNSNGRITVGGVDTGEWGWGMKLP